ncbi:hypothetical protein FRB97_000166 [Tulasnella sp. 331]|nr:hypothetical protein FRB97_000166 [Tulasnella sp. 331]
MPTSSKKKRSGKLSGSKPAQKTAVKMDKDAIASPALQVTERLGQLNTWGDNKSQEPHRAGDPRVIRAVKRATQKAENIARAEQAKEQGNRLFKAGNYEDAIQCYEGALMVNPNNPAYHSNVALAYLKVGALREAEASAEFALFKEPKNLRARYRRGLARQRLGRLKSAKADFLFMLTIDPNCKEVVDRLGEVDAALELHHKANPKSDKEVKQRDHSKRGRDHDSSNDNTSEDDNEDDFDGDETDSLGASDDFFPDGGPAVGGYSVTTGSHTSDYNHEGNKIPCFDYNHQGCGLKTRCPFSHGPGEKETIRDDVGKNVCLRFLANECLYDDKCRYSHSKDYLPTRGGPWDDDKHAKERFALVKGEIDAAVYDNFRQTIAEWQVGLGPQPRVSSRKL